MGQFDLFITSIPDSKAKLMVARSLASNPTIPLHTAMDMTGNLPLLLYGSLDLKEAEKHIVQLKKFGVGFRLSESPQEQVTEAQSLPIEHQEYHPPKVDTSATQPLLPEATPSQIQNSKHIHAGIEPPQQTAPPLKTIRSGILIGDLSEPPPKKTRKVQIILLIAFIAVFTGLFSLLPREKKFVMTGSASQLEGGYRNAQEIKPGKGKTSSSKSPTSQSGRKEHRVTISEEQRLASNAYLDSTRTHTSDYQRTINFYKIAISFNRYNLAAWQGLLQVYRELTMNDEADQTEMQMKGIFGEEIQSVRFLVEKHGELIDAYMTEEGIYRVEYRSGKRQKDDFLQETFVLTRALRGVCGCDKISIYASRGAGRGMLVHVGQDVSVHSLSAFSNQASVTWLE